jgi:hypothetical protein
MKYLIYGLIIGAILSGLIMGVARAEDSEETRPKTNDKMYVNLLDPKGGWEDNMILDPNGYWKEWFSHPNLVYAYADHQRLLIGSGYDFSGDGKPDSCVLIEVNNVQWAKDGDRRLEVWGNLYCDAEELGDWLKETYDKR